MTHDVHPQHSEPHVLDQPWRIWSTIVVMGILLAGILLYQWGGGFPPAVWSKMYEISTSRSAPIALAPVLYLSLAFLLGWMLLLFVVLHLLKPRADADLMESSVDLQSVS